MDAFAAINLLNGDLKTLNQKVQFTIRVDSNGSPAHCIMNIEEKAGLVQLDINWANTLGFEPLTEYSYGSYVGKHIVDTEYFNSLPNDSTLEVSVYIDKGFPSVSVQEPTQKTVAALMININKALQDHKVTFSYNKSTLDFKSGMKRLVCLSDFLNKTFDIPHDYWWKGSDESLPTRATINFGKDTPRFVVVNCSAIQAQQQPRGLEPVLKAFPLPETYKGVPEFVSFNPPIYIPLNPYPNPIETVKIALEDENGMPTNIAKGSITNCLVHFRERFY
jgi:hypothetical protein